MSLPVLLFFVGGIVDAVAIILGIYGYDGSVYSTTQMVMDDLKEKSRKMKGNSGTKMLNSLLILKIGFRSANFIDQTTPLVFLSFNNSRVFDFRLCIN